MSRNIFEKSSDLLRLRDEGYEVSIIGTHLVVSNIPYVTSNREIQRGMLVCPLELAGNRTCRPSDHVMGFTGSQPCYQNGKPIEGIIHAECNERISPKLTVIRKFSNKPLGGYVDYYAKVKRYAEILFTPAKSIDNTVSPCTFRVFPAESEELPFVYPDTNTGRAHIDSLVDCLKEHKVGIIGTGGTGSYVLDLITKTPVAVIRIFDNDEFRQHNAFRAPGAASIDQLSQQPKKVAYLKNTYSNIHRYIEAIEEKVNEKNLPLLDDLDFVFICIDSGPAKRTIIEYLHQKSIRFVDLGVGVQLIGGKLSGIVRITTSSELQRDHIERRVSFGDDTDDVYATNIQIADLNMLNAALAVIRWKKIFGFYADLKREHECGYVIESNSLINDDFAPHTC